MESWRCAERVQERRLWSTLTAVGVVLGFTLLSSVLLAATTSGSGSEPSVWFYLQQAVFLAVTVTGTVIAIRRKRAL